VKFHIPNVFGVYLHDTNNRNLFARDTRTLSHGCVRVGNALDFADEVLGREGRWSPERRERILKGWSTTTIPLEQPIPVHVMYETVWVDDHGRVHFAEDVYGRDQRIADALAGRSVQVASETVRTALP
jgi:murein L,D-transpeptidase YcbB/YkuD